ncbi:hypothetical protein HMPREF0262_00531 [Clostridium sp. ATCC 29733]|nr:hypothetical protein HMPREF0262_00531 [Clostridium sp. ATCC 29733]
MFPKIRQREFTEFFCQSNTAYRTFFISCNISTPIFNKIHNENNNNTGYRKNGIEQNVRIISLFTQKRTTYFLQKHKAQCHWHKQTET